MVQKRSSRAAQPAPATPNFTPVPVRYRHDGWTPEKQVAFIRALAECGCVIEACRRVGMSSESAYELARRPDAQSFRVAWDLALRQAVRRVEDGAFSRSINGVEVPHYYRGELVGTHRRYDERLTMFILARRNPERYGRHREDGQAADGHPEEAALTLGHAIAWVESDAHREAAGLDRQTVTRFDGDEEEAERLRALDDFSDLDRADGGECPPGVSSTSSTSDVPKPPR